MITNVDIQRRLVPRWRSLALTARSAELSSASGRERPAPNTFSSIDCRKTLWREEPSIVSAAELVETAIIDGKANEAVEAAAFLLEPGVLATEELKRLAQAAINLANGLPFDPLAMVTTDRLVKHVWRTRTRLNPANALAWVELSLLELITGRPKEAEKAMLTALALAPHSRHVLRAASRLFLHLGDAGHAHDVLSRNRATASDPWLMAAEVAMASVANRSPKHFRSGRVLIDDRSFADRDITELAGALATMEMVDGRQKKARDLFARSVIAPTGNSLAQAEWASPHFGATLVGDAEIEKVQDADEARATHLFREERFNEVVPICKAWSQAERYSIRPFEFGAIAASEADDYISAADLALEGLQLRPDAKNLLNTAAYSLANLGKLDEAERTLSHIKPADSHHALVAEANRGLIAIRRGDAERGLVHYAKTIEGFLADGNARSAARAHVYLAKAAAEAGLPFTPRLIEAARRSIMNLNLKSLGDKLDAATKSFAAHTVPTTDTPTLSFDGLSEEHAKLLSQAVPQIIDGRIPLKT